MESQFSKPNKRFLILGGGLILLGSAIFYFFLRSEKEYIDYPKISEGNIIAFGDSLTEGVGASRGNDYVSLLSRKIVEPIMNAGRAGDTTLEGLIRLERDVLSKNPRIVILLLGGNDGLRRFPPDEVFARLEKIIDAIHEKGSGVLLVGIRPAVFSKEYNRRFANLAEEKKISFVPDILADIVGKSELMFDFIHPNDRGYEIVASRLEPVLRKMLSPPGK